MSLNQLQFVRNHTVKLAEKVDETLISQVPKPFNNNILWNLGHIYVVHENLLFKASGRDTHQPEGFVQAFAPHTSPADWGDQVPSKESVIKQLVEQGTRINEAFVGQLDEKIAKPLTFPGFELATIRDLVDFANYHEAVHFNTVKLYHHFLKNQDLS